MTGVPRPPGALRARRLDQRRRARLAGRRARREVCLAVADEQTAGRGRDGRTLAAPAGRRLLLSLGFRPTWLAPERAWRLAAIVSLAMADAAEAVAGLPAGTIRLKWPNDLVVGRRRSGRATGSASWPACSARPTGSARDDPRVVVGIGVNADWAAADFPADLAGDDDVAARGGGGRPIDRDALLAAFLGRLEPRVDDLRAGRFDVADWARAS